MCVLPPVTASCRLPWSRSNDPQVVFSKINIVQDAIVHVVVEEGFEEVETEVNVDLPDVSRKFSKSKGNYLAPLPRRNTDSR